MILYSKRICLFYQDEVPPERFPVLRSLAEEIQFNNFTVLDTLKANDEHSLCRLRVLGPLRNMPEFYKAFNVKEGDYMYLKKADCAGIW